MLLNSIYSTPSINLHLTDLIDHNDSSAVFQHDCLYVAASIQEETDPYQIISYCLAEWPSTWNVQENHLDHNFTFVELYQQNITSRQLFLWSAPMDVIERYQLYLDQLSISNNPSSLASHLFYNCSLPRFGPLCQYSLDIYNAQYSSLNEMIYKFYQQKYEPTTLTCYVHLKCNRGSTLACLDWTEICDGYVDCLNDGVDEENCWQVEMNECKDNEYRCYNGQCIPMVFVHDDPQAYECLDLSDELSDTTMSLFSLYVEPTFSKEDIKCSFRQSPFGSSLTSSCVTKRHNLLKNMMLVDTPSSLSETCWLAFRCDLGMLNLLDSRCHHLCPNRTCKHTIKETCPDLLLMPSGALAYGHIRVAYHKQSIVDSNISLSPQYICYNDQLCNGFYSAETLLKFNNTTCRRLKDFPVKPPVGKPSEWVDTYLRLVYGQFHQCNTIIYENSAVCSSPTMYQCINSLKCISKHRLCDNTVDCDYKDDEQCSLNGSICSASESKTLFKCPIKNICISSKRVGNRQCECGHDEYGLCDDERTPLYNIRKQVSFPTICDGFTELAPVMINDRNETDETECQYWQCNNTYTRCDGFWNCFDGADEVDCDPAPLLNCPLYHHTCVSPVTYGLMCLPLGKANDGKIDCIGATDEPKLCRVNNHQLTDQNFYCKNDAIRSCTSFNQLCHGKENCIHGNNEPLCVQSQNNSEFSSVCSHANYGRQTKAQMFLCTRYTDSKKPAIVYFSMDKSRRSIDQTTNQDSMIDTITRRYDQRCHRGLPLRVWLNSHNNLTNTTCLCPPTFYGHMCQYQNQRVSLTLQFQTSSDSRRTLFTLLIALIDDSDDRIIHSYEQLTYLYIQHCRTKFNLYLLYSTRPKLSTKNYSIHIDIYEKYSLTYRGSLLIPVRYFFLPVHRIAVQLRIPHTDITSNRCSNQKCIHGRCIKYSDDDKGLSFCRCDPGWSGKYCTIPHNCTCSSDALCLGVSTNTRSICLCPVNKWGSQCRLRSTLCQVNQNAICQNGGQCISIDENAVSGQQFICICPRGFSGKLCEIVDNKLIISLEQIINLPQTMLIHFIRVNNNGPPENGSTFKTISPNQKTVTIRWSRPFHIALVELFDNIFYLITAQTGYNQSETIIRTIHPSDRCRHISEILNSTITTYDLLRRIKFYHIPCQSHSSSLSCFYDDTHFCLCSGFGQHRVANCFEFNHTMQHDCLGQSNCENGAQCLQDRSTCPQTSICVCPKCFYGRRCQFSSNLFDLSLDAMLSYHIQPHTSISHQPRIVLISVALTNIMIIIGLINGILSLITFKNKEVRKVGSGLYLIASTITTLFITITLALKFWIFVIAQITSMTNRSFLSLQCSSIDFLLRIGLNMNQWLNACVAMERVMTITKGTRFNKQKSKQIAKYAIVFLLFLTVSTAIPDPIHRRLITDVDTDEEQRIWCIVTFSSGVQMFNSVMNIFHFLTPFLINLVSAIIIIIKAAQQRTRIRTHETYQRLICEQFQRHIHIILSPLVLTILALPRLIISVTSGCMKSNADLWLYVSGYYLSYIPPTLTFALFVVPSKLYKEQFYKCMKQYRRRMQTSIHPMS